MAPHTVRDASLSKILAIAYTELNRALPKPALRGFPSVLQIEPTNLCNLRCPLCASGVHAFTRPTGMMSFDLYKRLLDEIGRYLSLLVLWDWGEPFLNPDIFQMIDYAKCNNIAVITSTNGQLLANPESAKRVVQSRLDTLAISLDGATQETYEKYRVGGLLDRVLRAFDEISEAKRISNSAAPLLNARVVVTRENETELPEIAELARRHGADLITFRSASMPNYCGENLDTRFAPTSPSYQMYSYSDDGSRRSPGAFVCRRPWKRLTVNWDGTFVACEHDYDNSIPFGRFPEDGTAAQIWNSAAAKAFRARFLEDRNSAGFCAQCPYNDRVVADCTVQKLGGAAA